MSDMDKYANFISNQQKTLETDGKLISEREVLINRLMAEGYTEEQIERMINERSGAGAKPQIKSTDSSGITHGRSGQTIAKSVNQNPSSSDMGDTIADLTPVIGTLRAGGRAAKAFSQGNYGAAALHGGAAAISGIGDAALLVPGVGAAIKTGTAVAARGLTALGRTASTAAATARPALASTAAARPALAAPASTAAAKPASTSTALVPVRPNPPVAATPSTTLVPGAAKTAKPSAIPLQATSIPARTTTQATTRGLSPTTQVAAGIARGVSSGLKDSNTPSSSGPPISARSGQNVETSNSVAKPAARPAAKPAARPAAKQTDRWGGSGGVRERSGLSRREPVGGPNASAKAVQAYSAYMDKKSPADFRTTVFNR